LAGANVASVVSARAMMRMVDLIVVRSLNPGQAKMASVRIIEQFLALMCKRDRDVMTNFASTLLMTP
jgi:hypothetical protein